MNFVALECPICDGSGIVKNAPCTTCNDGQFLLTMCGRQYVDGYLTRAINMTTHSERGLMPIAGGLLDQSAWYLDLLNTVNAEQSRIDAERYRE